jgi:GlpG protein
VRQVGDPLIRRRAERFASFLGAQGIDATVRADANDETCTVWVYNEDQMAVAEDHYRAFKVSPEANAFDAPARAPDVRLGAEAKLKGQRTRHINVRSEIFGRSRASSMPVTIFFVAVSVLMTLVGAIPRAASLIRVLYYSEYMGRDFLEITNGQLWRLVTPIFIHGGVLHLLFNMIWLYQLGGAIEIFEGPIYMAGLVLITGAICNTAQYVVLGSPLFMGMSGVVYALFGYIWMMSRYQAGTRYSIPRETVAVMLIWLAICLVGLIPGVANTEHVAGLVVGVAWGYLRSGYLKTLIRRRRYRG